MKVLTCIRDNLQLLPHFIRHYRALGVDEFWVWLHTDDDDTRRVHQMLSGERCRVSVYRPQPTGNPAERVKQWGGQVDADLMNRWRHDIDPEEWIVIADLDEFLSIDGVARLPDYLTSPSFESVDSLWGLLRDRIARRGEIPERVNPSLPISYQFPYACNLTEALVHGCLSKRALARAKVPILAGHHAGNDYFPVRDMAHPGMWIDHYRWCGDFKGQVNRRLMNRPDSPEYRATWDALERFGWKIPMDQIEGLRVSWMITELP